MGLYVEPKGDKLKWLYENGTLTTQRGIVPDDSMMVCCVDNGFFFAAAVAYDEKELKVFANPDDTRRKFWFYVKKELLKENCPSWDDYISEEV